MEAKLKTQLEATLSAALGENIIIVSDGTDATVFNGSLQQLLRVSKLPKKFDAQWILNKIASTVANAVIIKDRRDAMVAKMRAGLIEKGVDNFFIYHTTFGFSVNNLFTDGIARAKEIVEKCGIDYKRIEYSEAHWVVRVIL